MTVLPARFRSKIKIGSTNPYVSGRCWIWTCYCMPKGYGQVGFRGTTTVAHRVVYLILVGDISRGLELDHVCRNKSCVNPHHLEPVTSRENKARAKAHKKRCPRGHPLVAPNLVFKQRKTHVERNCRVCKIDDLAQRRGGKRYPAALRHRAQILRDAEQAVAA